MKKITIALLLLCSNGSYAEDSNVWKYLHALSNTDYNLQLQINSLKSQINNLKNQVNEKPSKHYIGEFYNGGIIFWLDKTKDHGLIATKTDINQGKGIQWRNGDSGNKVINARADGIGAGESNTRLIISQQTMDDQPGTFAALLASNYKILEDGETPCPIPVPISVTCLGGWYLPSAHELALLRNNLRQQGITTFAPDFYWSSTEANSTKAWMQNFDTGEQIANDKASTLGQVRAISRF